MTELRFIDLRAEFRALPGAIESPDGRRITGECPVCREPGAAVLDDDSVVFGPDLACVSCSRGCEPLDVAQAIAYSDD